jgi:DNA repair exonuclease SbcCD ATPase subunit
MVVKQASSPAMSAMQLVPCKRDGCCGACPRFVVVAGKRRGEPAICRECGSAFKLPPGSYAEAARGGADWGNLTGGGKGGVGYGIDKALLARVEALQRENAQLKSKQVRQLGATPPSPSSDSDDLAQAQALLEALRRTQAQGADVTAALQTQVERVQRLRDAKLASKPAHAQLKQLDEQIARKAKAIERAEASAEEFLGKAQLAKELAQLARGELEKLTAQKRAFCLAPVAGAAAPPGDPLGQMSSFTQAVREQLEVCASPSSPKVAELQSCFNTLEECLARLRAEVAESALAAVAAAPGAPVSSSCRTAAEATDAPAGSDEAEADDMAIDEDTAEFLLGLGVKREMHAEVVERLSSKRQKRDSRA